MSLSENNNLLTRKGLRPIKFVKEGDQIWSPNGWVKLIKKAKAGSKPITKFVTTSGYLEITPEHIVFDNGEPKPASEAKNMDVFPGDDVKIGKTNVQDIVDGLVIGDGTVHSDSSGMILLCIGEKDLDYFNSEIKEYIGSQYNKDYEYKINTSVEPDELPKTFDRQIPPRFMYASPETICSFLKGLYSANGSVVAKRVGLRSTSKKEVYEVMNMLSSVGINSYFTTNKSTDVKFDNGEYKCKESYDINISGAAVARFKKKIGFLQQYKKNKLDAVVTKIDFDNSNRAAPVAETLSLGSILSYEIQIESKDKAIWSNGLLVSSY